jgi:ornithine cyclodeaminase/alanine dehydrogenase-like protein (mu-crystallin family)
VLTVRTPDVIRAVEAAYRLHGAGRTPAPPGVPEPKAVALLAAACGPSWIDGTEWVPGRKENAPSVLNGAPAVLVLHDPGTGRPLACVESSVISAARTAASAVLAADRLTRTQGRPRRIGFLGTGPVARYLHTYLAGDGWEFDRVTVHDRPAGRAEAFADELAQGTSAQGGHIGRITVARSAEELIHACDLVVLATSPDTPRVTDPAWFSHNPLVLHLSLRDLSPEVLLGAVNVVDDREHCFSGDTSLRLTEELTGRHDFVHWTLHELLTEHVDRAADRPTVFSPTGLEGLDPALGRYVHDALTASAMTDIREWKETSHDA